MIIRKVIKPEKCSNFLCFSIEFEFLTNNSNIVNQISSEDKQKSFICSRCNSKIVIKNETFWLCKFFFCNIFPKKCVYGGHLRFIHFAWQRPTKSVFFMAAILDILIFLNIYQLNFVHCIHSLPKPPKSHQHH